MAKKKKRRVSVVRMALVIIVCVLIVVLVISLVVAGFKMVTRSSSDMTTTTETTKTVSKEDLSEDMQQRVDTYMTANPDLSEEQAIKNVKMNMDLEPYSQITTITDDSDMAMLVNKFYALPEGYVPSDLVDVAEYACVQGEDYSCQDVDQIQIRSEVYDAYKKWCEAAAKENIDIRAIAGYRSYEYQSNLWSSAAASNGEEYADEYYARPGQSEHNSGLSVDITFNGYNFNEIENYDEYSWVLENAHNYGFILRYPEDKVDITRYSYESWHFRYVGVDVATQCYENNWCLEEYWAEQ